MAQMNDLFAETIEEPSPDAEGAPASNTLRSLDEISEAIDAEKTGFIAGYTAAAKDTGQFIKLGEKYIALCRKHSALHAKADDDRQKVAGEIFETGKAMDQIINDLMEGFSSGNWNKVLKRKETQALRDAGIDPTQPKKDVEKAVKALEDKTIKDEIELLSRLQKEEAA